MSDHTKVFNYQLDGLSFTVTVYEEGGEFFADITVDEGEMDVNAIYFGDSDYSGDSASLNGPLNLNGVRLEGEEVQWDQAIELSDPGLGPDADDKETYLTEGETLEGIQLDITSLDDIDVLGIRATSTSTDEGSIKAVSDDPEEPEPEDPLHEKVFFGEEFSDTGFPLSGTFILDEEPDPNTYNNLALPEGTEPTFENYVNYFLSDEIGGDLSTVESVVFYGTDDDGNPEEQFRLDAPEGGFESADALLMAYDDLLFPPEDDSVSGEDLLSALTLDPSLEGDALFDEPTVDEPEPEVEEI
jgi:hypothetical protein